MTDRSSTASGLLRAWGRGDLGARDQLLPLVYRELRQRAAGHLRHERHDHTLQPTALVHEVYLRMVGDVHVPWQDRGHFFRVAANMMRRILVDHARSRGAAKRPPPSKKLTLDDQAAVSHPPALIRLPLMALDELTNLDRRAAQVMELRYFGGLSEQEVARVLSISRATVTREWQTARAWLTNA